MFNKYPYTDFHEINLDWILAEIMKLHHEYDEFKAVNTITNAGAWDITKQYQAWTIVSDNNAGYISLKPVPAGVAISNTEYWGLIADYDILITDLSNRISALENKTIMDYTDNTIQFPSDNPLGDYREQIVVRVPASVNKFVDNVIGIQNESHGPYGGSPDVYGNAAIAFFDSAQVERGAVGYSREQSIQPAGYVPNTLYIEMGNPFGSAGTDTDFRVIATKSTGFGPGYFYPIEAISQTGELNLRARGGKHVTAFGGLVADNEYSTYAHAMISPALSDNRCGISTNMSNMATGTKIDDNEDAFLFSMGEAYSAGNLGTSYAGFTLSRQPANSSNWETVLNITADSKIYKGNYSYNSWAFNGVANISNSDRSDSVPVACFQNTISSQPVMVAWGKTGCWKYVEFQYGDTIDSSSKKGDIVYSTGSGTINYNTTSDYRIKEVKGNADNALDVLKAIKIYDGRIKGAEMDSNFVLAHELQEVVPYAVTGTKDAVDADGNMILQQVDYSKLIPVMIKAIQQIAERIPDVKN